MLDHGQRHVLNVFRYATRLYYDIVHNTENPHRNKEFLREDVDKVCLIVSIWLHDWGMIGPSMPIIPSQFLSYLEGGKIREKYIKTYKEKLKKELNEILEIARAKLDPKITMVENIDKDIEDCKWIRPNHALLTYFNIIKESQTIRLDKLSQKLENYDRNLEDIATICLFHSRFSLKKLREFGKESLSGLCALLAFLDGCDETWQRLMSMEHVDAITSQSFLKECKVYEKINSLVNSENLRLFLLSQGINEEDIQKLREAWDEEKLDEVKQIIGVFLKTCKDEGKLVELRGDIEYYRENFADKSKMHLERKLLIEDVYFKNGEIILVPRHKLICAENPAIQKTVENIKNHLRRYRKGLEKLGLRFTEESVRLWRPEDGEPENLEIPELEVISFVDKSILCEVTSDDFYELVKNSNFIEKPLKEEEDWNSKKENVIIFDKKLIESASNKLTTHRILLITGPPNIGKSTFLLFFIDECLKRKIIGWNGIIFLNPLIKGEELDSVLEYVGTLIQSYGRDTVLLALDGLRRRESDENYVNKCLRLFEKASQYGYKLIATLRDNEKEFLKNKLENIDERGRDEWASFGPEEIRITYSTMELESILRNHLKDYKDKIKLEDLSFDEMTKFFFWEEIPPEKKEQYQKFKSTMEKVVERSEGLAGYIAFIVQDIAEHEHIFSEEVVEKYPIGMANLILNTIWRDYYKEENAEADQLIPLLIILLMKLEYPVEFSLTKHFFNSFKMWGIEKLDEKFSEKTKKEILEKIDNFIDFYTVRTIFVQESEYRLLNYWEDAIDKIMREEDYDKRYTKVVNSLKKAEKYWKYWINSYVLHTMDKLSCGSFHPDMLYLVGDIAKLWNITDHDVLDFSVAFFKKYKDNYSNSLPLQLEFLRQNLSFLLRIKAQSLFEKSNYDLAIDLYKKAIDIDVDDDRSYWGIGECYEEKGEVREALNWYIESAQIEDSSRGYGSLIDKIKNYYKKYRLPLEAKFEYVELQEAAARRAIECDSGDHIAWGMLGDSLLQQGNILARKKEYLKSISKYEVAIRSLEKALSILERMKLPPKDLDYWQIGYCHNGLKSVYNKLRKIEAQAHLKEAIKYLKMGAELGNCVKGYLQLARIMSDEDFYREDNSACKVALEKINVNELEVEDLIQFHYICGLDYENKGSDYKGKEEFEEALDCFEKAKGLIFSEEKMYRLLGDIYQHIGNCYKELGNYDKAAENYMIYLELNEYTPKGLSGKLFGIYGNKFLQMGIYDKAYYCFRRALKRDPTNIQNLDQMVIVNERRGNLEYAISIMEKVIELKQSEDIAERWLLSDIEEAKEKLERLHRKLNKKNQIAYLLEEICNIADSSEAVKQGEKREGDLSAMWYNVKLLLDGISPRDVDGDLNSLKISALCQSLKLNENNATAKKALELISHRKLDEIREQYDAEYHLYIADLLHKHNRAPILEAFHRIFCATIHTTTVNNLIKKGKLKGEEKQERTYRLSGEWGYNGRIISRDLITEIPHGVAIRCFELSVKINPENKASWHNLGWEYFFDSIKWGRSLFKQTYDLIKLDKASDAFKKTLEIEEKSEKEYSPRSKIGIGKVYESKGDAASAAKLFKEAASLCVSLYAEKDPQKCVDELVETASSLKDLRFLGLSKDDEIAFLRDALDLYKKALEISQRIEPSNIQAGLVREKVLLFEEHIKDVETRLREVEKTLPPLKPEKSLDEILSFPFKSEGEKIRDIVFQVTKKPEDYNLFKQVFDTEFSYYHKMRRGENLLIRTLDRIMSLSLKQATKESPFETPAKIFHSCQAYCGDLYGKEVEREFIKLFNERMIVRFAKIALGIEYKMCPIKSEEELDFLLNEFRKTFGKLDARTPSLDEINQAIKKKKRLI